MNSKKAKKLRKKVKETIVKEGAPVHLFRKTYRKLKKIVSFALISLWITCGCNADEILVPMSCYPKEVQAKFGDTGRKLDLSGNDRTRDSWGFLDNRGGNFVIYTYKPATEDDFVTIERIVLLGD